jgi:hypothetical protein
LKTRYNHDDENLSDAAISFGNNFIPKVESVFASLPKPIDWLSFYQNDLGITSIPENIKQWAATNKLNKSQTKTLAKLAEVTKHLPTNFLEGQRAMVAAKLANMPAHRIADKSANLRTSQAEAADLLNVGTRSVAPITNLLSDRRPDQMPHGNTGSGDR